MFLSFRVRGVLLTHRTGATRIRDCLDIIDIRPGIGFVSRKDSGGFLNILVMRNEHAGWTC